MSKVERCDLHDVYVTDCAACLREYRGNRRKPAEQPPEVPCPHGARITQGCYRCEPPEVERSVEVEGYFDQAAKPEVPAPDDQAFSGACPTCGQTYRPSCGSESAELAAIRYRCETPGEDDQPIRDRDVLLRMVDELIKQNEPIWDATDGAHPAWWRGHDHAAAKFAAKLQDMNVKHTKLTDELRAKLAEAEELFAAWYKGSRAEQLEKRAEAAEVRGRELDGGK